MSLCGGLGLQSHFRVQPNHCVEVVLCCVLVGVVTILEYLVHHQYFFLLQKSDDTAVTELEKKNH